MFKFSKEDNIEKNDIMKLDKMNYSKYYLNLAIQQKQQANQSKEIDKFVDDITRDYNKAIIFYNELVARGVELANLNLADCYDKAEVFYMD